MLSESSWTLLRVSSRLIVAGVCCRMVTPKDPSLRRVQQFVFGFVVIDSIVDVLTWRARGAAHQQLKALLSEESRVSGDVGTNNNTEQAEMAASSSRRRSTSRSPNAQHWLRNKLWSGWEGQQLLEKYFWSKEVAELLASMQAFRVRLSNATAFLPHTYRVSSTSPAAVESAFHTALQPAVLPHEDATWKSAEASPIHRPSSPLLQPAPLQPTARLEEAEHIQNLLEAIRAPHDQGDLPPMSPAPPPSAAAAQEVMVSNGSLASPRRVGRSFGSSSPGSPLGPKGTFRPAASVSTRASLERTKVPIGSMSTMGATSVGAVLHVEIRSDWSNSSCRPQRAWTEELVPPIVTEVISAAIGQCLTAVSEYGGVVHQFDMHSLTATFHVRQPCVDFSRCAVFCALAVSGILEEALLHSLGSSSEEDSDTRQSSSSSLRHLGLSFGIGVAQGPMMAGDLGTNSLRTCVVHGRPLTEARDLAALNFILQTRVLMSEYVHDTTRRPRRVRRMVCGCTTTRTQRLRAPRNT